MRRLVPAVSAIAVALANACSSFQSKPDEPTSPDAAAPDSSIDATPSEIDSATDAGIDVRLVCPTGAFCDDFERSTMPEVGWSTVEATGGTLMIVSDPRPRGGQLLEVQIPASAADGRPASLLRTHPTPQPKTRLTFDFQAVQPADDDVLIAQLDMTTGAVFVILRDNKLRILEGADGDDAGPDTEGVVESILDPGFHHVVVTFGPGATGPPTLTLAVDQIGATTIDVTHATGPIKGAEIGSTYARKGGAATFFFDDVVIETTF